MPFVRLRWLNSLSWKLLLAFITGVVLSTVLIVVSVVLVVRTQGDIVSARAVAERTVDLARGLRFDNNGIPVGIDDLDARDDIDGESWEYESLKTETAYRVLDASGNAVMLSPAGAAFWPPGGAASRLERGRFRFELAGITMLGATESVEHAGKTWFVQFAASTRLTHLVYGDLALPFAGGGLAIFIMVLLVVFAVCGYITLRFTLRPLRELSEAAAAITPQSLHSRLKTRGVATEIEPLVDSFNRALERLEKGYRIQQEFLATTAHELKTPLTLIRGQIELGVDEGNRDVLLRDVSHMGRQVQQLLHLAEASEPQNYEFTSVDARSLVVDVMGYLERLASRQGVKLQANVAPGLTLVRADRGALFTLLKNLLENAIQHSCAGGVVQLVAKPGLISVQDEGSGVLPEDFPNLFTRFWRSADRLDLGAGLGLSICQEIATAHGWTLQARRGETGMIFDLIFLTVPEGVKMMRRQ